MNVHYNKILYASISLTVVRFLLNTRHIGLIKLSASCEATAQHYGLRAYTY